MADPGIIRNKLKINAAIENAKTILQLQKEHGSFEKWLELHHPKTKEEWVNYLRKHSALPVVRSSMNFSQASASCPGAHAVNCPVYKNTLKAAPLWYKV